MLPQFCCSSSGLGPSSFTVLGCPFGLEVFPHGCRPTISIVSGQSGGRERERGISVALGCPPLLPAAPCLSAMHCIMVEGCPLCSCVCWALLAWVVPAARSVLGILFACLLVILYCQAFGRSLLRHARAQTEGAPIVCRIVCSLGAVASPARPILSWQSRASSTRPTSRPPTIGLQTLAWRALVRLLAFGCLPHCVWAAPSGVSDLLATVDGVAMRVPEAMAVSIAIQPPSAAARLGDSGMILRGGDSAEAHHCYANDEHDTAACSHVSDLEGQSTRHCAEEAPQASPLSGPGAFLVLCPYHQSTTITLNIPRPCDVEMVCNMAKGSLGTLQLEFARDVLPTVPQVDRLFGSLVVAPGWLRAADMEIVVWDFRPVGGPLYSAFAWTSMCYGDCAREVARHHVFGWCAFAFGNSYCVPIDASFLAIPGGVIQFRPTGTHPVWHGTLLARLNTTVLWVPRVELPSNAADRPLCVLHHHDTTLLSGRRSPGVPIRQAIAALVDREPATAVFATPAGTGCANLCMHGVNCRGVLAVFPLTPSPKRSGGIVFIDPRQVNLPLAHVYAEEDWVEMAELLSLLALRPPPMHHVSCLPAPGPSGRIAVSEGDTVLIGFRADVDSSVATSDDASQQHTESSGSDSDEETGPGESSAVGPSTHSARPLRNTHGRNKKPASGGRSRSPHSGANEEGDRVATPLSGRSARPEAMHTAAAVLPLDASPGLSAEDSVVSCRLPDEPIPGRPDTAGRTGLDRIVARTFGFWGGQTGDEPPNLGVAGPPQALNLGIQPGMMRIRVVVFPPEYAPETIDADVRLGCSVDEALRAVQTRRTEWRRRVFPVLVPVHPQPASGYAVALALSDWCQDRYVLMDCLRVERAMSCALCSEVTTRTSLLEVAGLAPGTGLEVFVHERVAPLGDGDAIGISTGFCITFVPASAFCCGFF